MQKSILIFGSGDNQLTLIKSVKERGYKAIVIDPNDNTPGKIFADAYEIAPARDLNKTIEIARKHNIDGIVTAQMENPLLLMAQVAERMGFVFPTVEQIQRSRNKFLMKQAFLNSGVPCAKGVLFKKNEPINKDALKNFTFPLIIKPADAFSSRGVVKTENFEELLKNEDSSRAFSSDQSVIVEEFIDGPEFSVESLTFENNTHVIQITEKIITKYPYTVELGHIQPANISESDKIKISQIVKKAIKALEINNCGSHAELKLTSEGPKMIEIGARLGGDYISSYLTLTSTGVNMDAAVADICVGVIPDIKQKQNQGSAILYLELPEGKKVKKIGPWKNILQEKDIVHAGVVISEGDIIKPITDSAKRPGFVITKGRNNVDAFLNAKKQLEKLKSYIELCI